MKRILFFLLLTVIGQSIKAQNVGIGTTTPNTSAAADIVSTTKGLLIPRLTTTQRNAVSSPAIGLMIYNTTDSVFNYYRSSGWTTVGTSGASPWAVNGANIYNSNSGRVGIGTTAPDASAKLDISSTTAGLLVPRMTIAQKISIASPATGLIVYDTDLKEFSYYDGTSWLRILNGNYDYWNKSLSRHWVYNITDSIGLGTSSPGEKLEVNGNIRSRDNITADGYITATGTVQGGALATTGNLLVLGTGVVSGDLQTNSDLLINNSAAILQLKSSNVNKGFYQLSGDNVRFGTNSGNTGGNVILRMDGDDMISFEKSAGATFIRMKTNGVNTGVLQTTGGNVSLSNPIPNGRVDLGGEIFINNTANRTGIGTSSPTQRLHVNGNTYVSGYIDVGDAYVAGHLRIYDRIDGNVRLDDTLNVGTVKADRLSANGGAFGTKASTGSLGYLAVGYDVLTSADGACIIADGNGTFLSNGTSHRMVMRFINGYGIYTNSSLTTGVFMNSGANSWSSVSDSTKKENFLYADGNTFLQKIAGMKLGSWNYKTQDKKDFRHYGPMAQEFYGNFGNDGIGKIGNDTTIASADIDGVMMIAIQALIKEKEILKDQYENQQAEIRIIKENEKKLVERVNKLEALLSKGSGITISKND